MTKSNTSGRGILTPTDREFLRGEKEYKNSETESRRRSDIRTRLANSIRDVSLILDKLPDDELRKAVESDRITADEPFHLPGETPIRQKQVSEGETASLVDEEVEQGLYDMLLLLYRVLLVQNQIKRKSDEYPFSKLLEQAHVDAIMRYKSGLVVTDIEHSVETRDRESLASLAEMRYKRNERLTGWEVQALLETDRVSDEELGEYVRSFVDRQAEDSEPPPQ